MQKNAGEGGKSTMSCVKEKMRKKIKGLRRWQKRLLALPEEEVWKVVHRERKEKKRINHRIEMLECKKCFVELFGGVEKKMKRGKKQEVETDKA